MAILGAPSHKQAFSKMVVYKASGRDILMNLWLDRIQIYCGGSLGIFDDLMSFLEEYIEHQVVNGGHIEKMTTQKVRVARYLMNRWLGRLKKIRWWFCICFLWYDQLLGRTH